MSAIARGMAIGGDVCIFAGQPGGGLWIGLGHAPNTSQHF